MKKQNIIWSEQNEGESYNVQIGDSLQFTAIVFTLFISTFLLLFAQRSEAGALAADDQG